MRILIVGSRGRLGSDLIQVFSDLHETFGVDRPEIDITQSEQCLVALKKFKPDVVINAAAFTRVDECELHAEEAFRVNGLGASNLAQAASSSDALLVHYSTDYVFDGNKSEPYVEEDEPNPQSVYGKSKLLGERLVLEHSPNHLIIRTSWLFGRGGSNFIHNIFQMARERGSLRVVNDRRGSPTYTRDLAEHTRMMVAWGCRGIFHVTNSGSCTWYELACQTLEWAGMAHVKVEPVSSCEFKQIAPRPANSVLAAARLMQAGLPLMRSWQGAAHEYVREYLTVRDSPDLETAVG